MSQMLVNMFTTDSLRKTTLLVDVGAITASAWVFPKQWLWICYNHSRGRDRINTSVWPITVTDHNHPDHRQFCKQQQATKQHLIWDSRAQLSWLCRRLARLTSSVCLRTPTCAPSTPSVSPSCPRISSWPDVSVASVLKRQATHTNPPVLFRTTYILTYNFDSQCITSRITRSVSVYLLSPSIRLTPQKHFFSRRAQQLGLAVKSRNKLFPFVLSSLIRIRILKMLLKCTGYMYTFSNGHKVI